MTCFWDSITSSLLDEDWRFLGINRNREKLIKTLQDKNKLVTTLWQGKPLSNKEKEEHFKTIKNYNIKGIYGGHMTSTCDSFLLLICEILNVNIEHRYLHTVISYASSNKARKTLRYRSNGGHFWRN